MAEPIASLYMAVVPTVAGIQGNLTKQLVPQANAAGNKAGDSINKSIGAKMKSNLGGIMKGAMIGAVATVAAAGIGKGLWDAVTDAGQLEQSVGAVNSVFKGSSKQMLQWSDDAAKAIGLSKNDYNELGTVIGSQLKNGGTAMEELAPKTNELITLGADLGSMFGTSTKEGVEALSSALKGERDPIEKFGVSLNQAKIDAKAAELGFTKVGGSLSAEANQAATMALIMEQTADAHGNAGREAETFAGKQMRMTAQWDNLKTAMGERFLPVMTNVFGYISGTALPALSRFGSFIEQNVLPKIQAFGSFLNDNKTIILSVVGVVGAMVAGFFAVSATVAAVTGAIGLATGAVAAVKSALLTARIAVMLFNGALLANPIGLIIAAIAGLVVGFVIMYNKVGWFKDGVNAAFGAVRNVVGNVVGWFTGTAMPWVQQAITNVGNAFRWVHREVIAPVMEAIKVIIAVVIGTILTIIDGLVWFFKTVLGPVFRWFYNAVVAPIMNLVRQAVSNSVNNVKGTFNSLKWVIDNVLAPAFRWIYNNVVIPVFNGIKSFIANAINGVKITFNNIKWVIDNVLAPVFRFLYDRVVRPVFDGIRKTVSDSWAFMRDRVFAPMKDALQNGLVSAFSKAKDGVERVWRGLQDVVKKPVRFVLETVLQNGLIKNINSVLKKVGAKTRIGDVWPVAGFRKGGYTGNYGKDEVAGVVHGREHVTRAESLASVNRAAPGFMDNINKYGAKALSMLNPAHMAVGSSVYGGAGSFGNPLQHAIYRSGKMNVSGAAPGWGLTSAIRMLDRATSVKVRKGSGGANTVNVAAGAYPDWWAGYYEGNQVRLNSNGIGPGLGRTTVTAHELGHALGLPHSDPSGLKSIMSYANMYQHNSVTDADVAALSKIYGGSGKGTSAGGGGGFFDWITEKLNPVKNFIGGISKMLTNGLGTGLLADMVSGSVKMITSGITDWITDKIKGTDEGKDNGAALGLIPTRYDGGGLLGAGTQLVQHGKHLKPDAVFTHEQTRDYKALAEAARRNQNNNGAAVINNGTVIAKEGIREVVEEVLWQKKMEESVHNL